MAVALATAVIGVVVMFGLPPWSDESDTELADSPPTSPPPTTTTTRPPPRLTTFAEERNGNWDIFTRDLQTGHIKRLTTNPGRDQDPSTNYTAESAIAFVSDRDDGDLEIYVMDHDGSRERRLTFAREPDRNPDWSPRQTYLVFVSQRDGNQELYVISADESGERRLTDNAGGDVDPAWTSNVRLPIGQTDAESEIAFASRREGNLDIYAIRSDGTGLRRLTEDPQIDRFPAWSPDGLRIAFVSERDGNQEVYVMNVDGSGQTRLTYGDGADESPRWSANGDRITFYSDRSGSRMRYSMRPDGSDQVLAPDQR